ncbi:MAG: stage II sporulation protein M [Myxococcaceae bacterium]
MAEALPAFVARRKSDWTKLETTLESLKAKKLALTQVWELDALYRRVAADLALAQTQYPDTDVVRFLNQLSARAYASIYRPAGASFESISTFYFRTFPALVRAHLGPIKLSATLLFSAVVLGALTVVLQPETANWLVDGQLRQFIDRKDLWTDHALDAMTPGEMATTIFLNNLRVLFTAFALGVTAAIGTVAVLLQNGLHVGALVATCFQGGVGPQILTFMCAHGPVELSLICISGGAGLHLGRALIDPGERSRATAVREHATAAVQLVLGCAPFMILIGIVEGFVSPGPLVPWPFKLAVGLLTGLGFWRWLLLPPRGDAPRPAPR